MSLVVQNDFGEYYNALVTKPRSIDDLLKDVRRDELAHRKRLEDEQVAAFGDVLHVTGVWISQKKEQENGRGPKMDRFALSLYNKQREIWFPAAPPKLVEPNTRGIRQAFPMKAYREMCEEEAELRRWLHGVEAKLREHIEHACQESYYVLTCFQQLLTHEARSRARIEKDEAELMAEYRKKMFMIAPPDFYRRLALERHGLTGHSRTPPPRELTFEETETFERERLMSEETRERIAVHQPLLDAINAQLFMANHQEICGRAVIEEDEGVAISKLTEEHARASFGVLYYCTPILTLHAAPRMTPVLGELCRVHMAAQREAGAAFTQMLADVKKDQEENGVEAWEMAFPAVAAQMYAAASAARRSTSSSVSSVPPKQVSPQEGLLNPLQPAAGASALKTIPTPPAAPLESARSAAPAETTERPASAVSFPSVEVIATNSVMKKDSRDNESNASGTSMRGTHSVRFNEEVHVVTIDPLSPKTAEQGFQSKTGGRSMDWDDMGQAPSPSNGAEDEGEGKEEPVPAKKKKTRVGKRGSFHAFESDSDNDQTEAEYTY